jgi:hypothetical protein
MDMGDSENPVRFDELSAAERMILALKGDQETRIKLVQDRNRAVWAAVLASPMTNELDAELISEIRDVEPDVLREIGKNRQWTKHYKVCLNLVMNPTTPTVTALALLPRLSQEDQERVGANEVLSTCIRGKAKELRAAL